MVASKPGVDKQPLLRRLDVGWSMLARFVSRASERFQHCYFEQNTERSLSVILPRWCAVVSLLPLSSTWAADPQPVRPVPPPGINLPDSDRKELEAGAQTLEKEIADLRTGWSADAARLALVPDVQIFHKAVDWALRYNEFFDPKQIDVARAQLALGMQRAKELRAGKASWNSATGLVVRGYVSKIDGSIQPYGLVVPANWTPGDKSPRRLDFWLHGRNEKLSELAFINERLKSKGEFAPEGVFVLHPYGRFCNANKFAGEVDLFEALEDARKHYPIDTNRLVVRGFSMGGAACWQFATHHPAMWAAAAPGAGFAETAEFFKVFAPGKEPPPWWEQMLWRWYDSTLYAANLLNCPTIAYSGEIDAQKQAADIMIRYAQEEGVTIPHVIGPQTAHKYHPEAKPPIEEFITKAAIKGRARFPREHRFVTYTLAYPSSDWLQISKMEKHWERTEVEANADDHGTVRLITKNVIEFGITVPEGVYTIRNLIVDGDELPVGAGLPYVGVARTNGKWQRRSPTKSEIETAVPTGKRSYFCGPIDHAFTAKFIFVKPTGKPLNPSVEKWVNAELNHATEFWRRVFRGDAPVKNDTAVTADDISNAHLVLWGDPSSNALFKKIVANLPLTWTPETLEFYGVKYDSAHHAPIIIFPNPLNPHRYIVLNSGPTFREQALLNNSDQTPKLPDWAIVDLRTPPGAKWPGLIVDAGFFDEEWRLPAKK